MQHHDYDEPGRIAGPCVISGMPIEQYHGGAGISKSGLDEIAHSPFRWWGSHMDPRRPRRPRVETASQLVGNLAHCAVLERGQFASRYRVGPIVANKNLKEWQSFKKECEADGAAAIDQEQYDMAMRMRENVLAIPDLAALFASGQPEESVYWNDPETGVLCRCRPDWTHPLSSEAVLLADVKTYDDASAEEFTRQVARMRYDVQDAFYSDGYRIATGKRVAGFIFIALETCYPYAVNALMLDDEGKAAGARKYRRDLNTYAECLKTNVWPAYGNDIKLISLPKWAQEAA